MASDVAGQALLQSGVVKASKAEFHGKELRSRKDSIHRFNPW